MDITVYTLCTLVGLSGCAMQHSYVYGSYMNAMFIIAIGLIMCAGAHSSSLN